ncbi:hypothetical protein VNO78_18099 [Psophocarpus tetragonolobus]|uniref:Uncharacterized protein n=1 Tax=Psophocarpus tetragonolobus TaxID=3891 RepID=A0AAN9SJ72_PSOTE
MQCLSPAMKCKCAALSTANGPLLYPQEAVAMFDKANSSEEDFDWKLDKYAIVGDNAREAKLILIPPHEGNVSACFTPERKYGVTNSQPRLLG